jgi:hypothetical protein
MFHRLSQRLASFATGWVVGGAVVVFVLFSILVLPGQAAQSAARSGGAAQPDTSLIYSPADLYRMAEAFGPAGRPAYIYARLTFDAVFPIVYGVFLIVTISWLAGRAFGAGHPARLLNLIPAVGMLFDYLENSAAVIVMARYPLRTPVVDFLAPVFTFVKWVFVGGSFVVLLAVAAVAAWRWVARRFPAQQ